MNENCLDDYLSNDDSLNDPDIIHKLSVVTTHYVFRNSPVEDMHAQGKLSDNAMMRLNKFIVNRLAYILRLILDRDIKMIKNYLLMGLIFGQNWDCAIPDSIEFESFLDILKNYK